MFPPKQLFLDTGRAYELRETNYKKLLSGA